MSASLPSAKSADVKLVVATPEELRQQWHYNSAEWIGPLTLEAYIRREEYLLGQDLTKNGGLTPWLLVYQPDANGPRKILCGCETIKKKAIKAKNGIAQDLTCHGVCSVFCPAEHRGKGYAGRMMTDLAETLRRWRSEGDEISFSVLFSDIGKEFYTARGWQVFPSAHFALQPSLGKPPDVLPNIKYLKAGDIASMCEQDAELIRQRLIAHSSSSPSTTVAIIPDVETIRWHQARADFFAEELYQKPVVNKGAVVEMGHGKRAWCYWHHRWTKIEENGENVLYILRLAIEGGAGDDFSEASPEGINDLLTQCPDAVSAVLALLAAAQMEAAAWKLKSVVHWNPSSLALAAAQMLERDIAVEHRETSSITSLLWFGEERWQDVQWVCNERYGWC